MPRVLILASPKAVAELEHTVLFRSGVERVFAMGHDPLPILRATGPQLVLFGDDDREATLRAVRAVRENADTRGISVAVVSQHVDGREDELRMAGANAVFAGGVVPCLWDAWLEQLLTVAPRREARVPVRFDVWAHDPVRDAPVDGTSLNVSTKGMLLETLEPADVGTRLEVRFRLPDDPAELRTVAQVVRGEPGPPPRLGISFLILRDTARDRIRAFVESAGL